jgi:ferric-dicitrate binding protein FerR (iron transport regulator)
MSEHHDRESGDHAADDALRQGLRTERLSAEAMQRIRRATEAEWRTTTQALPRRRWTSLAAAASVAILATAGVFGVHAWNHRSDSGALLGSLQRAEAPGVWQKQLVRGDLALAERADLRVLQTLDVRGDSLVALAAGGNLRMARGSTLEITAGDTVRLTRGELYVDIPPGQARAAAFTVLTPAGEFRHVGTQFAVAIVDQQTRLRVREGRVQWQAAGNQATVDAGNELLIDRNLQVTRRAIATAGREWSWAETLAPEVEIENRPLREFLEWFARETGRKLELADDVARQQAATIRMHGSVRGLTALEALAAVMAATTLHYELPEGAIRVSSASGSAPPG